MRAALFLSCLVLAACSQFPELEGTISPDLAGTDYPALVPIEQLLADSAPVVSDPAATSQSLEERVAALRNRARLLQRRAVVDSATRARLLAGIS